MTASTPTTAPIEPAPFERNLSGQGVPPPAGVRTWAEWLARNLYHSEPPARGGTMGGWER